jgi:hypothetical protein
MDPMIATGGVRAKGSHSGPSISRLPSAREEEGSTGGIVSDQLGAVWRRAGVQLRVVPVTPGRHEFLRPAHLLHGILQRVF